MILEKLHRAINNFTRHSTGGASAASSCTWEKPAGVRLCVWHFSTLIWGVCWLFKINYNPDLIAVAWAVPVLLDTLVKKAYDWNNEVRDWD